MSLSTPTYQKTRQAWRDIWIGTEFDRELKSLDYPRAQETMSAYLPYLDKRYPVLEAGCGPAHIVYALGQRGYRIIGLDYAPEPLGYTHARFPDLPLHLGDVHTLPYPADYFGGYLSFGVVEHFEHGPQPALREAYRTLRPGGVLVLTVPHPQFVESLYQLRERLVPAAVKRAGYYERTYDHDELAGHVQAVGFSIEAIKPLAHSYTYFGLSRLFRNPSGYYESNALGERVGALSRRLMPWKSAFHTLIIGRKG